MPFFKVFLNSAIATMTIFQTLYSETQMISYLFKGESALKSKNYGIETILLQNGLFYFGLFVGTQITSFLQKQSNKFIFLFSDLLNIFAKNIQYLIYNKWKIYFCFYQSFNCHVPEIALNLYLIIQFLLTIAFGINLTQAVIYLKHLTYKTKKGYLFLLIPLQIQIGLYLGWLQTTYQIFDTFIISCSLTVIRMILLLIVDFETPNYYYFVKQNLRVTKQILQKIHNSKEIQKQIIQNFSESQAPISRQLIKKTLLCFSLVLITQLSGFQTLCMYYILLTSNNQHYHLAYIRYLIGIFVIITFIFFGKKINKSNQILIGQAIVCLGLGILGFTNTDNLHFNQVAIFLMTFGYYTGLGSLIYQIIPILLPDLGVIQCMNALWMTNLAQLCIMGIIFKKQKTQESYLANMHGIVKLYFYFSCFGFLFLLFILKNHNKVEEMKEQNEEVTKIELAENSII